MTAALCDPLVSPRLDGQDGQGVAALAWLISGANLPIVETRQAVRLAYRGDEVHLMHVVKWENVPCLAVYGEVYTEWMEYVCQIQFDEGVLRPGESVWVPAGRLA